MTCVHYDREAIGTLAGVHWYKGVHSLVPVNTCQVKNEVMGTHSNKEKSCLSVL